MWSMSEGICLLFLVVIAIRDIQTRQISVVTLILGIILSTGYQLMVAKTDLWFVFGGLLTGGVFMLLSKVTKEGMGYGDSFVILILGIYLGARNLFIVLSVTFFLLLCVSVPVLCIEKMSRKHTLPFLPFLAGGYVCFLLMGGVNS